MGEKASDAELTVLAVLLGRGPLPAAEIHAALEKDHGWATATVLTFLRRLEAKGLVEHSRPAGERAFVFRPTRRARASRRRALRDVLDRIFGGNPLPLMSSLIEESNLKREQLEELQRLIEDELKKQEERS